MTVKERIAKRRKSLLLLAQAAGWSNWSEYETAHINGLVHIHPIPETVIKFKSKQGVSHARSTKSSHLRTKRPQP